MSNLFDTVLRLKRLTWQRLERPRVLRSILNKVILVLTGGFTKELCIAAYLFSGSVVKLGRKSGWLLVALYLKQAASSLRTAYGGVKVPPALLPFPISLTRSGYPRIIPSFHRLKIGKGDDEADRLVRMYLSFFSLYKVITLAKSVNDGLFSSIVEAHPKDVARSIREYAASLGVTFPELLRRYVPDISSSPLHVGIVWEDILNLLMAPLSGG